MKKSFYALATTTGVAALLALSMSVAQAGPTAGQSVLGPDIPVEVMSAAEMEAVEGEFFFWRIRINGAEASGDSSVNPTSIPPTPLGGGTYSVEASETATTSSVSIISTCSSSCSSTVISYNSN